jgi:hypothetical protein
VFQNQFPSYIAPDLTFFRPEAGALFLQSKDRFSVSDVLSGKESTHMLFAERVLPDLIQAASNFPDATANALSAPIGLADPNGSVKYLIQAATQLKSEFGRMDVPWGDVNGIVLVGHDPSFQQVLPFLPPLPASGSGDPFGGLRALYYFSGSGSVCESELGIQR